MTHQSRNERQQRSSHTMSENELLPRAREICLDETRSQVCDVCRRSVSGVGRLTSTTLREKMCQQIVFPDGHQIKRRQPYADHKMSTYKASKNSSHCLSFSLSRSLALSLTLSCSLSHALSLSFSPSRSHVLSLSPNENLRESERE